MKDITKWWINYMPLTEEEQQLLLKTNTLEFKSDISKDFEKIENEYFRRMPLCNISEKTHHITFTNCATDIINGLFEKFVDDDTLVIHSNNEHDNVKKNLEKCKHTLEVDYYNEIIPLKTFRIINEAKKYSKVFVYIIGTQISTGEITPQLFFERLKQQFLLYNIKHTITLDDVHGMFLVPRDYSIFDYVLYTAHALIRNYDMGLLISKDKLLGIQSSLWGDEYLKMLDVVLKRKEKIRLFSHIMREEFYELLLQNNIGLCDYTTPHIFSLKTNNIKFTQKMYDILDSNAIRLEGIEQQNTYIRFRAQHYIQNSSFLVDGLDILYNILSSYELV